MLPAENRPDYQSLYYIKPAEVNQPDFVLYLLRECGLYFNHRGKEFFSQSEGEGLSKQALFTKERKKEARSKISFLL